MATTKKKTVKKTLVRKSISVEIFFPGDRDEQYFTTASKKIAPYVSRVQRIEYDIAARWVKITFENNIVETYSGLLFIVCEEFK